MHAVGAFVAPKIPLAVLESARSSVGQWLPSPVTWCHVFSSYCKQHIRVKKSRRAGFNESYFAWMSIRCYIVQIQEMYVPNRRCEVETVLWLRSLVFIRWFWSASGECVSVGELSVILIIKQWYELICVVVFSLFGLHLTFFFEDWTLNI